VARTVLGRQAIRHIHAAVAGLFQRARARFLGRDWGPKTVEIFTRPVDHRADLSLPGVFDAAAATETQRPNERLRDAVTQVAASYLDAYEAQAKARVVHAVQAFLHDAEAGGARPDVRTVLGGQLADVMGEITHHVKAVVATETTRAANVGTMDATQKVAALTGQGDPTVFFVVVRDAGLCSECRRLHLLPDGVTPRVWKLSEVGAGYHDKGQANPKVGGLHPHCRCTMCSVALGYGFNGDGQVRYVADGHDEYAAQRGAKG